MPPKRISQASTKNKLSIKNSSTNMTTTTTVVTDTDDLQTESTQSMVGHTFDHKQTQQYDEFTVSMSEIRKMITDLKQEQNNKLDALQETINDIRKQNNGIIESVEHLSNEYKDLKKQLECMEKQRKDNLEYIQTLENRIETLEKTQINSSIEIKNIPPRKGESKRDLLNLISTVGKTLDISIQDSEIRDVFRKNTKTEDNKPIVVDFTSIITKDMFIQQNKKFNNQHKENKFNTTHLRINGPPKNIYISENLTPRTRRLFFLARDFAKSYDFNYCWTAGGKIYIRKKEGDSHLRINTENDLDKLKVELKL